jgi:phospholipase/carboxylesterase
VSEHVVAWSGDPDPDRPLLVLLHGRGSDEQDLFSLAPLLPPVAAVASVRAPYPLGPGFTWFAAGEPGLPDPEGAKAATLDLLEWLDSLPEHGPVWLLGFSQGGAMVTQLLRFAPERFAASVVLAGFSLDGEGPEDARLERLRPRVFWGRDPADPVIPRFAIDRTDAWLSRHSTLTKREYPGVGHSISRDELDDVNAFLAAD